jgi:carbon-monoxide dehydrogenase catalytic subunit
VDPFGEGPQAGVCGADADIIVARNLCRMVAAGAASHSDHGRDLVEVLAGVADGSGHRLQNSRRSQTQTPGPEEYGVEPTDKAPWALPASWPRP